MRPVGAALAVFAAAFSLRAQSADPGVSSREPGPIQDNSFLVEEAYNQDPGVVQHIQQFVWTPFTGSWVYTFTQEWPVGGVRNQLSYTVAIARVDGPEGATGLGDLLLNYRYQLVGDGEARVALAPRLSLVLPTGNALRGLGSGGAGVQVSLPLSVVLSPAFQANVNAGATWIASAEDERGDRARTVAYNFGSSLIFRESTTLDLLVEAIWVRGEIPIAPGRRPVRPDGDRLPGRALGLQLPEWAAESCRASACRSVSAAIATSRCCSTCPSSTRSPGQGIEGIRKGPRSLSRLWTPVEPDPSGAFLRSPSSSRSRDAPRRRRVNPSKWSPIRPERPRGSAIRR